MPDRLLARLAELWSSATSGAPLPSLAGVGQASRAQALGRRAIQFENLELSDRAIDARSVVTIIVFFIVNLLVIFPVRIPLPLVLPRLYRRATGHTAEQPVKRWYFVLGLETAPVIGVLLLLASTCITGGVLRDGIVGGAGVRPYDIMTLFLSFAYIALSLDRTNLLRYLAFHVATRSASSGRRLYAAFFGFFSLTGFLVGNDPLILSGTPFLAHFSRLVGIAEPVAYLFTQFQTANLVSALLVSSNPTNLVLSSGFGLSFLSYSAWMALPTAAATAALYPTLRYWVFRKQGMIPLTLTAPPADPANALHDPVGAVFGGCLFLVTIVVLIALSAVGKLEGVEGVWTVTAPAAILILLRDVAYDVVSSGTRKDEVLRSSTAASEEKVATGGTAASSAGNVGVPTSAGPPVTASASASEKEAPAAKELRASPSTSASSRDSTPPVELVKDTPTAKSGANVTGTAKEHADSAPLSTPESTSSPAPPPVTPRKALGLGARFPTVISIITHLPWTLIPFAFSMFILVEALSFVGWIRVFAGWWAAWCRVSGTAGAVALMGVIGALGCNIFGTNIGCTVLLSRVMQQWSVLDPTISQRTLYGAVLALAVGSNFGAYSFVFPASLAGLLWRTLLEQKGLHISRRQFARWNVVPLIVTVIVACLVVAAEVCVMLPGN